MSDQLPPLPPYVYGRECSENEKVLPLEQVRAYAAAAVAAERERRRSLAADFGEYLYRTASQVPFEHAEWARKRGAALLAKLTA